MIVVEIPFLGHTWILRAWSEMASQICFRVFHQIQIGRELTRITLVFRNPPNTLGLEVFLLTPGIVATVASSITTVGRGRIYLNLTIT